MRVLSLQKDCLHRRNNQGKIPKELRSLIYIQTFGHFKQQGFIALGIRAHASHAEGRRFESRTRHIFVIVLFLHFFLIF